MLLVTGATGYLGGVLVTLLRDRGLEPLALVRGAQRASALPEGVPWVTGEITDPVALRRAVEGCSGVFHLAASLGDSPAQTRRLNVGGTEAMLAAARAAGVRRFVHTSSAAAIVDRTGLVSELAEGTTALDDPYSVTKAEAERVALAQAATPDNAPDNEPGGGTDGRSAGAPGGLEVVVVNPVSIYGPSPAGPRSYNGLFAAAAAGEVTSVVDAQMGWVLANDVALGMLLAFQRGVSGRRYVLCGEVAGAGTVLRRYLELVGGPHRLRVLPPGSRLEPGAHPYAQRCEGYGALAPVRVDDRQARALGFEPTGLADGLAQTARWLAGGTGTLGG